MTFGSSLTHNSLNVHLDGKNPTTSQKKTFLEALLDVIMFLVFLIGSIKWSTINSSNEKS